MARYIRDVRDYSPPDSDVVKDFLTRNHKEGIRHVIEQIVDDELINLEAYANEHISDVAADRAERFLERVLNGDQQAASVLIGKTEFSDGRHESMGVDEGKPWAKMIYGRLYETDAIKLRRKIVEAHTDLIQNERIADLESIVDGLQQQIQELEAERERGQLWNP